MATDYNCGISMMNKTNVVLVIMGTWWNLIFLLSSLSCHLALYCLLNVFNKINFIQSMLC